MVCSAHGEEVQKKPKLQERPSDTDKLSPEEEEQLQAKLERQHVRQNERARRKVQGFQAIADKIRDSLEVPKTHRIRYEPRAHKKDGWVNTTHAVMSRVAGSKKGSKTSVFHFKDDDEFELAVKATLEKALGEILKS